jgi:hypothetical protein
MWEELSCIQQLSSSNAESSRLVRTASVDVSDQLESMAGLSRSKDGVSVDTFVEVLDLHDDEDGLARVGCCLRGWKTFGESAIPCSFLCVAFPPFFLDTTCHSVSLASTMSKRMQQRTLEVKPKLQVLN